MSPFSASTEYMATLQYCGSFLITKLYTHTVLMIQTLYSQCKLKMESNLIYCTENTFIILVSIPSIH